MRQYETFDVRAGAGPNAFPSSPMSVICLLIVLPAQLSMRLSNASAFRAEAAADEKIVGGLRARVGCGVEPESSTVLVPVAVCWCCWSKAEVDCVETPSGLCRRAGASAGGF
jgi:hypothetical protein